MSTCVICLFSEFNASMLTAVNLSIIRLMTEALSASYTKTKEVKKVNRALHFSILYYIASSFSLYM